MNPFEAFVFASICFVVITGVLTAVAIALWSREED